MNEKHAVQDQHNQNDGQHQFYFDRKKPVPVVEVLLVHIAEQYRRKQKDGGKDSAIVRRLTQHRPPQQYSRDTEYQCPYDQAYGHMYFRRMYRMWVAELPKQLINGIEHALPFMIVLRSAASLFRDHRP